MLTIASNPNNIDGDIINVANFSETVLEDDVTAKGGITFATPVVIDPAIFDDVFITSLTGDLWFMNTVDSAGASEGLEVDAPLGNVWFNDNIGSNNPLGYLTVWSESLSLGGANEDSSGDGGTIPFEINTLGGVSFFGDIDFTNVNHVMLLDDTEIYADTGAYVLFNP